MDIKTIHNLMLPNYLKIVKEIGSKNSKTRTRDGRGKHNSPFFCGAFCEAKYEIQGRRKRGWGGYSFSSQNLESQFWSGWQESNLAASCTPCMRSTNELHPDQGL